MSFLGCTYFEPWWAYLLRVLLEGTAELIIYSTPVAICAVVWDVFANKGSTPGDIKFLGLDDSAPTYCPSQEASFPIWTVLLYLFTGFITFGFGVLVFDFVQALSFPGFALGVLIFDAVQVLK